MRKILNKKGFSLVELVVVVALMGIVLGIAVPSYRSSQVKAQNKACKTNIEVIKLAVVDYYTSYQVPPESINDLAPFLDKEGMPVCEKNKSLIYNYGVAVKKNANNSWSAIVVCACDDESHTPDGEDTTFPTESVPGECYILQQPSKVEK